MRIFALLRRHLSALSCPAVTFLLSSFLLSQSVDKEILDVLPKMKEAKNIVGLMDRDTLTFDVALQRTEDEVCGSFCVAGFVVLRLVPFHVPPRHACILVEGGRERARTN